MHISLDTYIPGNTLIHCCDARVKLILLLAYSITLFMVTTWKGLLVCLLVGLCVLVVSKVPIRRVLLLMTPVFVLLFFVLLFNSFTFDVTSTVQTYGLGGVSSGIFEGSSPLVIVGNFGFMPDGFVRGSFYVIRILLLVIASLVVSFTTTSNDLTNALNDFLKPLRAFKVPTTDIAMMFSIALRFIPITADEFMKVRDAQWARGASFDGGSLWKRLRAWQTVFVPVFVGLFRRADNLALAMESRCYGMSENPTQLNERSFTFISWSTLVVGIVSCLVLSIFL